MLDSWAAVSGSLGVGTETPGARLDVRGAIKLGSQNDCAAANAGTIRWTGAVMEVCDGDAWKGLLASDANLAELLRDNDGAGSGLDADRLDGLNSSQFMRADQNTGSTGSISTGSTFRVSDGQMGGANRDWMNRGVRVGGGGSDGAYFGLKVEGDNAADTVVAWGDDAGDDLRFIFAASGGAADGSEYMRVTSAGQVGIGTSNPVVALEVNGSIKLAPVIP